MPPTPRTPIALLPALAVVLGVTCLAGASQDGPADDALRGPSVPDRQAETLVSRTMTGRFVPLETRPESAAVQRLGLDQATLEQARRVIEDRAFAVTMHLVDHLDTIREMTDANIAGDREQAERLFEDLWSSFDEETSRSPLLEPLASVLGEDDVETTRRLVDEYWEAWIVADLRSRGVADADEQTRGRVSRRLAFGLFQSEVRDSYETSLRRYQQAIEGVSNAIGPTPEQRQQIRLLVIDHIKATRLKATPAQRRETNLKIYRMLDDERKEKMFEYMTRFVIPDEG